MRIALFGRSIGDNCFSDFREFLRIAKYENVEFCIHEPLYNFLLVNGLINRDEFPIFNREEEVPNFDYLFSIGGDGTFLRAAHLIHKYEIPIIGINAGRLGFLADINHSQLTDTLKLILNKVYNLEKKATLKLIIPNLIEEFALNEISILRKDTGSLIIIHVWIDDIYLNGYWADGLVIATPTGSTAYSLAAGGPIIHPHAQNLVLTPIAPHSLNVRPLVISNSSKLRLKVESRNEQFLVSADNHTHILSTDNELFIEKGPYDINTIQFSPDSFYNTLKNKLMWGIDKRNE